MGTLREDLRFINKFKEIPGTFGLEIEAEVLTPECYPANFFREEYNQKKDTMDVFVDAMPQWIVKRDDSLRNYGLEYVLQKPLSYEKTLEALDTFGEATKGIPFIKGSPSTSVHTHINMTNETPVTMGNFCTTYMLYENLLVEFCGETRRSNLFALPTRVAEKTMNNLVQLFSQYEKGESRAIIWGIDSVKYAALNLACLNTLGSLEIRSFRGTTDVSEIKQWVSILNRILMFAKTDGMTPRDILRMYRNDDLDLYYSIFGPFGSKLMGELSPPNFSELVERNLWYAKSIADSVKSWPTISDAFQKMEAPKLKEKKKTAGLSNQYSIQAATPTDALNQLLTIEPDEPTPSPMWAQTVYDTPPPFAGVNIAEIEAMWSENAGQTTPYPDIDDYEEMES